MEVDDDVWSLLWLDGMMKHTLACGGLGLEPTHVEELFDILDGKMDLEGLRVWLRWLKKHIKSLVMVKKLFVEVLRPTLGGLMDLVLLKE